MQNSLITSAIRRKDTRERGFHIDDMTVIGTTDTDSNTDFKKIRYATNLLI